MIISGFCSEVRRSHYKDVGRHVLKHRRPVRGPGALQRRTTSFVVTLRCIRSVYPHERCRVVGWA